MKKYFMRFFYSDFTAAIKYMLFAVSFTLLIVLISQIYLGMGSDTIMVTSSDINDYGSVTLKLLNGKPSDNISVLINGVENCKFVSNEVKVRVDTQALIEVYNNESYDISVEVADFSESLSVIFNNEIVSTNCIAALCRVILKN